MIINSTKTTLSKLETYLENLPIKIGGEGKPTRCLSSNKVAIIVAYRNRQDMLLIFLRHLHQFLTNQQIEYGIFIVEPLKNLTFNRGLLMNIGYLESLQFKNWDCFIFHGNKLNFHLFCEKIFILFFFCFNDLCNRN